MKSLEHRYDILHTEKTRNDKENRLRNEQNIKTISNLKLDLNTLGSAIEDKNLEIRDFKAEIFALKDLADHRVLDINKLKAELNNALDEIDLLNKKISKIDGQII